MNVLVFDWMLIAKILKEETNEKTEGETSVLPDPGSRGSVDDSFLGRVPDHHSLGPGRLPVLNAGLTVLSLGFTLQGPETWPILDAVGWFALAERALIALFSFM